MRTARLSTTIAFVFLELFAFSCGGDDEPGNPSRGDASSEEASPDVEPTPDEDAGTEGEVDDSPSETEIDEGETSMPDVGEAEASAHCGDGIVGPGEVCDDGFRDSCGACSADCREPGDGRPHVACGCAQAADAGPAGDGGLGSQVLGEEFTRDMLGCPGHVQWDQRGTLCAAGYTPCDVDQWIARRAGKVPRHHYWTNDNLKYVYLSRDGVRDSCYYSKTYGRACDTATHVCADVDQDPEGNKCSSFTSTFPRNCGRFDPPPIANDYFGGYYGNFTAGALCCCDAGGTGCADNVVTGDMFSNGMFGCVGRIGWQQRASLCATGCTVCTAQEWIDRRQGKAPTYNYWTDDNLKLSGSGDGMCNVSKLYGTDGTPYPMRVCAAHQDPDQNECYWINCGAADIAPPPNEYLGGCSDIWAGTLCCKP
jgi:hypothetical protein